MKWILAQMLEMDADQLSITTELAGPPDRPETVYMVRYAGGERHVALRDVLEYVEKYLKDDPIAAQLPRR